MVELPPQEILLERVGELIEAIAAHKMVVLPGKILSTGDIVPVLCLVDSIDDEGLSVIPFANMCPLTEPTEFYGHPDNEEWPVEQVSKLN